MHLCLYGGEFLIDYLAVKFIRFFFIHLKSIMAFLVFALMGLCFFFIGFVLIPECYL